MCNHSNVSQMLDKANKSDATHPLKGVIDQPLIDPILQGDMSVSGDVIPGSYVDKKNQNLGVSDVSQAATFFAKSIAAAFGLAAAFGATGAAGGDTATGATASGGTATGESSTIALEGGGGVQVGDPGAAGAFDAGGTGGTSDAGLSTPGAGPTQGPTTGPTLGGGDGGTTLGGALKMAAQAAPLVSAAANLLAADSANNQAQNAQNAANNLEPSTPPPTPQPAVDPDLSMIRKKNALIFGLDSPSSTDLTLGKADMGSLGRVTLLGGSTNRLGA